MAAKLKSSVYIYGATGFGKTITVERIFDRRSASWISCSDSDEKVMRQLQNCDPSHYAVIDDLCCLENVSIREKLVKMLAVERFRMVLIGRSAPPSWLSDLVIQSKLILIPQDDLRVTKEEFSALCEEADYHPTPERMQEILNNSQGQFMILDMYLKQLSRGFADEAALSNTVQQTFMLYLEEHVINQWSRDIRDFLLQMSVVDSFTIEQAEYMTGDDHAAQLLERANCAGNLFVTSGEQWKIRPVLLETLRRCALTTYGRRRYEQLVYNAALYHDRKGHNLQALKLYEECGDSTSIQAMLIREARNHPGVGHYWLLRKHYQALPQDVVGREPVLMSALSILYSVLMNTEKSEYWYERLQEYAENARGDDRNEAYTQLAYLNIGLPHRGTKNIMDILRAVPGMIRNSGEALRPVSLTNNQPSVMNGGKDFCEWTKRDVFLAQALGPLVEKLLGKTGVGLSQTALGESAYEKGEDPYKVLIYLTKAQNQSENNGMIEMTWVDIGIQARLALCRGDIEYAHRLADGMLRRVDREQQPQLAQTIEAFSCWLDLYINDTGRLKNWLETSPDEASEFCTLNRYLYMVKIQCYLALGEHTAALTLLQRMLAYADYAQRTYIRMECRLLKAILLRRTSQPWVEELMQALEEIGDYHFVAIISEKGTAIYPMLQEVKEDFCGKHGQLSAWLEQVMQETDRMARLYPELLKGTWVDISTISAVALKVLRLQADGLTTREIAEELHITQRTVKYHSAENYKKLNAKNLVEAVRIAQGLHIL